MGNGKFEIRRKTYFGPWGRYALHECVDRFGDDVFMVLDAEIPDETGLPGIIRQASTKEEAMRGLETETPVAEDEE